MGMDDTTRGRVKTMHPSPNSQVSKAIDSTLPLRGSNAHLPHPATATPHSAWAR
jgi:hypothetical protein